MKRTATAAILGVTVLASSGSAAAAPAPEVPPVTATERAEPDASAVQPVTDAPTKPDASAVKPVTDVPTNSSAPTRPEASAPAGAPGRSEAAGASMQADPSAPVPVSPRQAPLDGERRWLIRQAPLAGAEPSWGPPGQVPEYVEMEGPERATNGPPSNGTPRIATGAILGPLGLALAITGIVGASTSMLGDHKNLSVPMIGAGLVTTAIGAALLADGILRRQRFMRWQASKSKVALVPSAVPGRFAGATLVLRF